MRKLFTLTLALLASFSLWAADPTLSFGTTEATSSSFLKTYAAEGITISSDQTYQSTAVQIGTAATKYDANYLEVLASNAAIDSIHVLISGNGSNKNIQSPMFGWATTANNNTADTYDMPAAQTTTANGYSYAKWFKYDLTTVSVKCARIYKQSKNISSTNPEYTGSSTGLGSGQTIKIYGMKIWLHPAAAVAPKITAPTTDQSASYTIGDEITALSITATGTPDPTYQWYYNNSASTEGATSLGAGAQTTSYTPANDVTSDLYYYCVATNTAGSATSPYFHITVNAPSAPSHKITYNAESLKGQSVSGYPTEFYEGIGIASFDALPDVTNFHFNGWNPASIGSDVTTDVELTATWVAAYNVTFNAGDGSGTVPTSFQKWAGATFELPGQGDMVAPSGKAFDGWKANGTGDKLPANTEYTMTASAVEFVAQWKGVPQTIFEWAKGSGAKIEADNTNLNGNDMGTLTTGTSVVARKLGTNNIDNNKEGYKLGNNDVCVEIQGTSAFAEGDTVIITGYNGGSGERCFAVAPSSTTDAATDTVLTNTISSQTSNSIYRVVIKSAQAGTKIRVFRKAGSTMYIKGIKVIRPAAREIASTVITLSDLKVNNRSISSDSLATLVSAHSLELKDSYAAAPEIKFNEHTVITYADGKEPETKVTDKVYTVTASVNGAGKWEAAQEINSVTYTVTAVKLNSAKVYYYDGATKLGEEVVALNDNPVDYADYQTKSLYSFAGWYNNSDLAEEHKIADISALTVTKDTTVYGKWTPLYASSVNIEQIVLDEGTSYDLMSYMGSLNYASNITNSLDSLNDLEKKDNRNYAYLGLKVKAAGKLLNFRLGDGIAVKVKFGAYKTGSEPQVSINGSAYSAMEITDGVYTHTADGDELVSIKTATADAVIFKQIMIGEDLKAITLPDPSAYLVTIDKNIEDGTVTANWPNKKYRTPIGETVTLTVTPADGYKIASVTLDGEPLTPIESVYSFTMPSKDVTVSATFSVTTALDNTPDEIKAVKFIENGQLFIRRGEKVYTITGEEVK